MTQAGPVLGGYVAIREGKLAARTIYEVVRQKHAPALRIARFMCFMAEGRRAAWEAWTEIQRDFGQSMFQDPFIALGEQLGLDEANVQIRAFAKEFCASFERDMDAVVGGSLTLDALDETDRGRMRDWLSLMEKFDRAWNPTLTGLYGPSPRKGLFRQFRLE